MSSTFKAGPATISIFRIGLQPGGKGPIQRTTYIGSIFIGNDEPLVMYGDEAGSGNEEGMVGGYLKTLYDASRMSKKSFLKTYQLAEKVGGPVWEFAEAHAHEIHQAFRAFEDGEIQKTSNPSLGDIPHYYGKDKGRRWKDPMETQEHKERRESQDILFLEEETASQESQSPMYFYDTRLSREEMEAYQQEREGLEITVADIYDVVRCTGRWGYLRGGGWPCKEWRQGEPDPGPITQDDIDRAIEWLIFHGYRLPKSKFEL